MSTSNNILTASTAVGFDRTVITREGAHHREAAIREMTHHEAPLPEANRRVVTPHEVADDEVAHAPAAAADPDVILRFRASERQMHWAVAIPFMVCYLTAATLIAVYNPNPQRPFRVVFSWTHRISAICLFLLPAITFLRHWDMAMHKQNIKGVFRWTMGDIKWLILMGPNALNKKIQLPEQGKFNAAEKINFMVLTATVPLYLISGIMIWTHQFAFPAWVVHLTLAANATPLLFGHIFMATVNPDTRVGLSGMITGYVSRQWASHHYALWYKENFGELPGHGSHGDEHPSVDVPAPLPEPAAAAAPAPAVADLPLAAMTAADDLEAQAVLAQLDLRVPDAAEPALAGASDDRPAAGAGAPSDVDGGAAADQRDTYPQEAWHESPDHTSVGTA